MINAPASWPGEKYQCVRSRNYFNDVCIRTDGNLAARKEAEQNLQRVARDHARIPMQWDNTNHGGFCALDAKPWMPALDCSREINVKDQVGRTHSPLEHWRRLLGLRKKLAKLFVYGHFQSIEQQADLMMFTKTDPDSGDISLTVANMAEHKLHFEEPTGFGLDDAELLIDSRNQDGEVPRMWLAPFEARIYLRKGAKSSVK